MPPWRFSRQFGALLMAALSATLSVCTPAQAATKSPSGSLSTSPRIEIPIERTVMLSGTVRYTVSIKIGAIGPIPALLDTGSTGLLVMASALGDKQPRKIGRFVYSFDSGEVFSGGISRAKISIGGLSTNGPVNFGVVQKVKCTTDRPKCPAVSLKPQDYGIAGDGTAGEGFKAIIGIGTDRILLANPLLGAGAQSWIVALPLPGTQGSGSLIINPDPSELEGFQRYPIARNALRMLGAFRSSLPGCLGTPDGTLNLCGQVALDTGSPQIYAKVAKLPPVAAMNTPQRFTLTLSEGDGRIELPIEETWQSKRLVVFQRTPKVDAPAINAGVLPYHRYLVFYDFHKNVIGLKKR